MIIGLLGNAGCGKDTIAELISPAHLVALDGWKNVRALIDAATPKRLAHVEREPLRARAVQIALADPLKEYALDVYDFSVSQLWGPSDERNTPDRRYPREGVHVFAREDSVFKFAPPEELPGSKCKRCKIEYKPEVEAAKCIDYLTPREALQQLGTEWGRRCYDDTWINYGLRRAQNLLANKRIGRPAEAHTFQASWVIEKTELVVISDIRFVNEVKLLHQIGAEVWKITRPGLKTNGAVYQHLSESEQKDREAEIAPMVTAEIANDGTFDELRAKVSAALKEAGV
jgi:hypothetical protein